MICQHLQCANFYSVEKSLDIRNNNNFWLQFDLARMLKSFIPFYCQCEGKVKLDGFQHFVAYSKIPQTFAKGNII